MNRLMAHTNYKVDKDKRQEFVEIISKHVSEEGEDTMISIADSYIKEGYDPESVYKGHITGVGPR